MGFFSCLIQFLFVLISMWKYLAQFPHLRVRHQCSLVTLSIWIYKNPTAINPLIILGIFIPHNWRKTSTNSQTLHDSPPPQTHNTDLLFYLFNVTYLCYSGSNKCLFTDTEQPTKASLMFFMCKILKIATTKWQR